MKIRTQSGFTIVELMIVIIVIAILATLAIVGYRASMDQLVADTMKSDLNGTAAALENHKNFNNGYPAVLSDALKVQSEGNTVTYTARPQGYCLEVVSSKVTKQFYKTETGEGEGQCSSGAVVALQQVTANTCPVARSLSYDARDNQSYWIQKLADGRCWMLTNLSYLGGGDGRFGDTKTLVRGVRDMTFMPDTPAVYENTYTQTQYPAAPSTVTDGGTSGEQYGQLYNWCGAMGGQEAACTSQGSPIAVGVSVCPAGWGVPTQAEVQTMLSATGGVNSTAGSQALRTNWLLQYAGSWGYYGWSPEYDHQGEAAYVWTSTLYQASSPSWIYGLSVTDSTVNMVSDTASDAAISVRCVRL